LGRSFGPCRRTVPPWVPIGAAFAGNVNANWAYVVGVNLVMHVLTALTIKSIQVHVACAGWTGLGQ